MNIQINKMSYIYFLLENVHLFIFLTLHPQLPHFFLGYTPGVAAALSAPLFPAVLDCTVYC